MNFNTFKTFTNSLTQSTIGGLVSFKEYVGSAISKFTRFSSRTKDEAEYRSDVYSTAIRNDIQYTSGQYLSLLTQAEYDAAVRGEDVSVHLVGIEEDITFTCDQVLQYTNPDTLELEVFIQACQADEKAIGILSPALYNLALQGDNIAVSINDAHELVLATGDNVSKAIEDALAEMQVQKEYIGYCLDNTTTRASEFATLMASKFQTIPNYIVENYSNLLSAQDPVMALKGLFSTFKNVVTSKASTIENQFISIVDAASFTGCSILETAWNNVWGTITSFFDIAWEGITKIGDYIQKIFNGLVNATKYLINLVMKPLTTRFEKAGASVGILDVPIAQYQIAKVNWQVGSRPTYQLDDNIINTTLSTFLHNLFLSSDWIVDLESGNKVLHPDGRSNDGYEARFPAEFYPRTIAYLLDSVFEDVDGVIFSRPYDVILPSEDDAYGMVARVGLSQTSTSDEYYLNIQIYALMPNADISTMHDGEVYNKIRSVGAGVINNLYKTFPRTSTGLDLDSGNIIFGMDNNVLDSDDNIDLIPHCHWFNFAFDDPTSLVTISDVNCGTWSLISALIPYILIYGPEYYRSLKRECVLTALNDSRDYVILEGLQIYGGEWGSVDVTYPMTITPDLLAFDYQPYTEANLFGASVHYQSLSEAANEFIKYIIVIFIAAAATFIAVKWNRFKKKRIALAEINQGHVDNMSWTIGQNPDADTLKKYYKAKKVARKTSNFNNLLGISPSAARTNSVMDVAFSIKDQLMATSGTNPEIDDYKGTTLYNILRLINPNV